MLLVHIHSPIIIMLVLGMFNAHLRGGFGLILNRENFSVAFSDRSRREQEPIMLKYVSEFVQALKENCDKPLDMCNWFNFITFDIGGEFTFGTSFDCLKTTNLHVSSYAFIEDVW